MCRAAPRSCVQAQPSLSSPDPHNTKSGDFEDWVNHGNVHMEGNRDEGWLLLGEFCCTRTVINLGSFISYVVSNSWTVNIWVTEHQVLLSEEKHCKMFPVTQAVLS